MMTRACLILLLTTGLAACGQRAALTPPPQASLPPAPYGGHGKPDAEALLTPPPQAVPVLSVELRSRSEEREDDPFDLPPQ